MSVPLPGHLGREGRSWGSSALAVPARAASQAAGLTSWQKCPMPRILKEPLGCTFSHLRKTVVPATWDSAQLCSRGLTL